MEKKPGDIIVLHMCIRNYDHMMQFLRCGTQRADGQKERTEGQKKWHIGVSVYLKTIKKRTNCGEIFFNLHYKCAEVPQSTASKSVHTFFLLPPLFSRTSHLQSRINKMANENSVDYQGKTFFFFLEKERVEGIYDVQIAGKHICKSKIESRHFYFSSQAKLSQVLIITPRQRKVTHFSRICPSSRKGGNSTLSLKK